MAHEHGTASSGQEFYDKLLDFLQNNTDLVNSNQAWTKVWTHPNDASNHVLHGPGNASDADIYISIRYDEDTNVDRQRVLLRGLINYVASAQEVTDHIGVMPHEVMFYFGNSNLEYWFTANGRRFMGVVKTGTTYHAFYAGLFLQYALPTEYDLPLYVAGTVGEEDDTIDTWNDQPGHGNVTTPANPSMLYTSSVHKGKASGWLLKPDHTWAGVAGDKWDDYYDYAVHPKSALRDSENSDYYGNTFFPRFFNYLHKAPGGGSTLIEASFFKSTNPNKGGALGAIDGMGWVQQVGNTAETDLSVADPAGGPDIPYKVFPDVFRTNADDMWAMRVS